MLLCILLEMLYSTIQQWLESAVEKLLVNAENDNFSNMYADVLFLLGSLVSLLLDFKLQKAVHWIWCLKILT